MNSFPESVGPSSSPSASRIYDLVSAAHDFPQWSGMPDRTIVICTQPRSGSTLLGEALYFAGGLGCPLEYFHPDFRALFEDRWGTVDIHDYVRTLHARRTDPSGTLSVKLFWHDIANLLVALAPGRFDMLGVMHPHAVPLQIYRDAAEVLAPVLPASSYVHLVRRDRVRRAISVVTAQQTGIWRVVNRSTPPPKGIVQFDYDAVAARIAVGDLSDAHWRNFFAALDIAPLTIDYEAIADDYPGTVGPLLAALGRDVPAPEMRLGRQTSGDSERMVMQFLRERRRRSMLASDS